MAYINTELIGLLNQETKNNDARWIAVTKLQPIETIQALYDLGLRDFGENRVQELLVKQAALPGDIRWHQIGHLQRKKVRQIIPFVELIHSVDSISLLDEIEKQAVLVDRRINILIQVHIAEEEHKEGVQAEQLDTFMLEVLAKGYKHISINGLMGLATFTQDEEKIAQEFHRLRCLFDEMKTKHFKENKSFYTLSMGMSGDYKIALLNGANLLRIGSLIFKQPS